jgi:hypothetical protein
MLMCPKGLAVGDGDDYVGLGLQVYTSTSGYNGNGSDDNTWSIGKNGNAYFASVSQGSDARMKSVIGDVRIGLADMANAPLVLFDWRNRENDKHHVGTIAQYWEAALPEVVTEAQNGMLTLAYGELGVAMGISLAKELSVYHTRVANVENDVQGLKEKVEELKRENEELRRQIEELAA